MPGHRDVIGFATPARLEPVARDLSALRGRRTRLVLQTDPPAAVEEPDRGPGAGPERSESPGQSAADRRSALQIPLVRQAMEFFPDATLIDVRDSTPPADSPPPADADADDPEDSAADERG